MKQFKFLFFLFTLFFLKTTFSLEMVSIKGSVVNFRKAPETNSKVLWQLTQGYPLTLIKRQGKWLKVKDFENDTGWVAARFTSKIPHYVVKSKTANVRSGPGIKHKKIGRLERYDVVKTIEKKPGWVFVDRLDGMKGWVASKLLWGW